VKRVRPLWITPEEETQTHGITGGYAPFYRTEDVDKMLACVTRHSRVPRSCTTRHAHALAGVVAGLPRHATIGRALPITCPPGAKIDW
jgi:hypothetical protein